LSLCAIVLHFAESEDSEPAIVVDGADLQGVDAFPATLHGTLGTGAIAFKGVACDATIVPSNVFALHYSMLA